MCLQSAEEGDTVHIAFASYLLSQDPLPLPPTHPKKIRKPYFHTLHSSVNLPRFTKCLSVSKAKILFAFQNVLRDSKSSEEKGEKLKQLTGFYYLFTLNLKNEYTLIFFLIIPRRKAPTTPLPLTSNTNTH